MLQKWGPEVSQPIRIYVNHHGWRVDSGLATACRQPFHPGEKEDIPRATMFFVCLLYTFCSSDSSMQRKGWMWGPCSGAVAGRRPHWDCSPGPPGCKPEPSAQTLSSGAELRKMPVPQQQKPGSVCTLTPLTGTGVWLTPLTGTGVCTLTPLTGTGVWHVSALWAILRYSLGKEHGLWILPCLSWVDASLPMPWDFFYLLNEGFPLQVLCSCQSL